MFPYDPLCSKNEGIVIYRMVITRPEMDAEDLITLEELCNRLMISETTAYRLMRSGDIPAFKVGSHWKIPADAVKRFIVSIPA